MHTCHLSVSTATFHLSSSPPTHMQGLLQSCVAAHHGIPFTSPGEGAAPHEPEAVQQLLLSPSHAAGEGHGCSLPRVLPRPRASQCKANPCPVLSLPSGAGGRDPSQQGAQQLSTPHMSDQGNPQPWARPHDRCMHTSTLAWLQLHAAMGHSWAPKKDQGTSSAEGRGAAG